MKFIDDTIEEFKFGWTCAFNPKLSFGTRLLCKFVLFANACVYAAVLAIGAGFLAYGCMVVYFMLKG